MSTQYQRLFQAFAAEFHPSEVKSRSQAGRTFSYITARVAMNRLDEVLGGENWKDEYFETEKGIKCRLWFRMPGTDEWLWKEDGGASAGMPEADNDEKSGYSDAFKRAAVKLGIARYLYGNGVPIYPAEAPPRPDNRIIDEVKAILNPAPSPTGKGSGLGTKEHLERTKKFNDWVTKQCEAINAKWHGEWEARCEKAMENGYGVPSKIPDVINPWGFKGHLVKWAVETQRLDPSIVPEDVKTRQNDALSALVYCRSPDDRAAVVAEMGRYLNEQRHRKADPIYRSHPELAPEGYLAEQAEDEPENVQAEDAVEAGRAS